MNRFSCAVFHAILLLGLFSNSRVSATPWVSVPSRGTLVFGTGENSDHIAWDVFMGIASPVANSTPSKVFFETWATDADTFTFTPHWPDLNEPMKLQSSVFARATSVQSSIIDAPCLPPPNAAIGGFPTSGTPSPCISEQVVRNRPQFDYIVQNGLNTQAGLAAAFAKSFKVDMPVPSISVKGDWVPVKDMLAWISTMSSVSDVQKNYYTAQSGGVLYALVALHVSTKQLPNWVWFTFEHQLNPGRCDTTGCYDSYGAERKVVPANKKIDNTTYPNCSKSKELKQAMAKANLNVVWENYCLKSSQINFVANDGTPSLLGNSVTERINANNSIASSSCITCHGYAAFGSNGQATPAVQAMLAMNPAGRLALGPLKGSIGYDFMWGFLLAPPNP